MLKKTLLLAIISLFWVSLVSHAVIVENLYQSKVEVSKQSSKLPWKTVLAGFKEVLVRKSGSSQLLRSHDVQQAYAKVTTYLQRYEYVKEMDEENNERLFLLLNFSPKLVDDLIRVADMPIWSNNRPVTLMWLALEESSQREVIKEEEGLDTWSNKLNQAAQRRGVPMILPLMDLDDRQSLNINDLWGRFPQPILSASSRYSADAVVGGSIRRYSGFWQGRLVYLNQGIEQNFELKENSLELLFNAIVDQVAELLCQKYCVVEAYQSNQVTIQVSDIKDYKAFYSLKKILSDLPSIRSLDVGRVAQDHVRFSINLLGDINSVREGIKLIGQLSSQDKPYPDPFMTSVHQNQFNQPDTQVIEGLPSPAVDNILYYRWEE